MKALISALLLLGLSLPAFGVDGPDNASADEQHARHHGHGMHHWAAPAEAERRRNPVAADEASIGRGQALFQNHCAACHGEKGAGGGPAAQGLIPEPPNLQKMAKFHSDGDLAWKIAHGRGAMPAWQGTLKEEQIWDLVNYLRHLARH